MPTTTNNQVYFQAPWQAPANVHTCITTAVNDFNLAKHVNDDPQKVLACRIKLRELCGLKIKSQKIWGRISIL